MLLQGCYLDELFASACMFMDSHALVYGQSGLQLKLKSLLWEIGSFFVLVT